MDSQKPGHTTVESLKLSLALRRCQCADHRRRSRRPSPSATGACRCATSDPGAPRPIPDAHIRHCRLHWVPSTRPYNTTKQSVHGGHRARGPTISPLRPCMQHPVRLADTRRRDRTRRPWALHELGTPHMCNVLAQVGVTMAFLGSGVSRNWDGACHSANDRRRRS